MAALLLNELRPAVGPTSGGHVVRLVGANFSERISVRFGEAPAIVVQSHQVGVSSFAVVQAPAHSEGLVDVSVEALDASGQIVAASRSVLSGGYRFVRHDLLAQATLTRLVRRLLQMLKAQVLENTSLSVATDYDDGEHAPQRIVTLASLPALILSGPTASASRFYASNVLHESAVAGANGVEIVRRRPAMTVDLSFTLTAATEHSAQLLNLMAALAAFFNRNPWISMPRDPALPDGAQVRWEMDTQGDLRSNLRGQRDVRVLSLGLVIRGFDIDEGLPSTLSWPVQEGGVELWAVDRDELP